MIHGAVRRSQRKPAMKVCVPHLPNGACALSLLRPQGAATQPRHLGVDRCLVDEDQAMRLATHLLGPTPPDPGLPGLTDVLACAFRGHQRFMEWPALLEGIG